MTRGNQGQSGSRIAVGLALMLGNTLACGLLGPALALGGPSGELDANFGANGRLLLDLPPELGFDAVGWAAAEQPGDGKLLLGGHAISPETYYFGFIIVRLNPDGAHDESFGAAGVTRLDFDATGLPGDPADGFLSALAVAPDGSIVAVGQTRSFFGLELGFAYDAVVVRFASDGTPDPSFGDGGEVRLDFGGDAETLADLEILPDGKILLAGTTNRHGDVDTVFVRLNPDGSADPSFGDGTTPGFNVVRSAGMDDVALDLTAHHDGFVACGWSTQAPAGTGNGYSFFYATRIFENGSTDPGFGNGAARHKLGVSRHVATSCLTLTDGTLLLAGYSGRKGEEDATLAWLGSNGDLDRARGWLEGFSIAGQPGSDALLSITELPDGSVAATGLTSVLENVTYPGGWPMYPGEFPREARSEIIVTRIDSTWGEAIETNLLDFGHGEQVSRAYGRAILLTTTGELVVVGTTIEMIETRGGYLAESPRAVAARLLLAGDGHPGFLGLEANYARFYEDSGRAVLGVRRTAGSSGPVSIDYRTADGTATSPSDFPAASGTLFWADGETGTQVIEIPVSRNEDADDYAEYFFVELEAPSGGAGIATSRERVWILYGQGTSVPSGPGMSPQSGGSTSGGGGAFGTEILLLLVALRCMTRRRGLSNSSADTLA